MAVFTTIDDPSAYFKVQLWTGDGNGSRAIAFDDTDTTMRPSLVWIKARSFSENHELYDSTRGVQKRVMSNDTGAEETRSQGLLAFSSDGFTVGTSDGVNKNTETYVAWCWKESATAGFDIVTYTGSGSAKTESHSLSAVPEFIAVKTRSETGHWRVYHGSNTSAPETDALILNENDATYDLDTYWNDTAPTSSVFSVGTHDQTNKNTVTYVSYLWRSIQGFSKFTSYQGTSSTDGSFIYCGFSPKFIMVKKSSESASANWLILDNKRDTYNPRDSHVDADNSDAESSGTWVYCDFLSNGFKWRANDETHNESGSTYIVMAFADAPLVNSKGVPNNAQ